MREARGAAGKSALGVMVLCAFLASTAPMETAADTPQENETLGEEASGLWKLWKQYTWYMDSVLEDVIELDLWGISTPQLPKGILKFKYRTEHQKATQKYEDGKKVNIAPSLSFPLGDQEVFFVDLQGKTGGGRGFGHTIQMSYGISNPLDFYVELPFQAAEVRFDVDYRPGPDPGFVNGVSQAATLFNLLSGGPEIDLNTEEGFWRFIEALGRPRLKTRYKSETWDLGDIHMGFSYNYLKKKHFAAATTGRVYLPTGWQPDPNNSIELFTGAGFPAGQGAWGLSTTQGFDFRLPGSLDWVIFNLEFTYEYRFRTRRAAPTFPKRSEIWDLVYELLASEEPDIAALFPDLSDMGDYYWITFGHSFDGEVGLTLNPFKILPVGIKYAGGWSQKPKVESSDPDFIHYVEAVEIVGEQAKQLLAVGTAISLIPFYIPLNITFEYRIPLWGHGAFVVEENYAVTAEAFVAF